MARIVYKQAAALWPLLSPGGSSAMAPIVYRQAVVVQRSYSESEVVREYGQGLARPEAVRRRFGGSSEPRRSRGVFRGQPLTVPLLI